MESTDSGVDFRMDRVADLSITTEDSEEDLKTSISLQEDSKI